MFAIEFTFNELSFMRQALDVVSVQGKDAKFVTALQNKLEHELEEIKKFIQAEEAKKAEGLKNLQ